MDAKRVPVTQPVMQVVITMSLIEAGALRTTAASLISRNLSNDTIDALYAVLNEDRVRYDSESV